MILAYLTGLPLEFLRSAAGFMTAIGAYFIPRAHHQPSKDLQEKIWLWLSGWEQRFAAAAQGKSHADGSLDEDDLAGLGFLRLLRQLRIVLLQDIAVLQQGKCSCSSLITVF